VRTRTHCRTGRLSTPPVVLYRTQRDERHRPRRAFTTAKATYKAPDPLTGSRARPPEALVPRARSRLAVAPVAGNLWSLIYSVDRLVPHGEMAPKPRRRRLRRTDQPRPERPQQVASERNEPEADVVAVSRSQAHRRGASSSSPSDASRGCQRQPEATILFELCVRCSRFSFFSQRMTATATAEEENDRGKNREATVTSSRSKAHRTGKKLRHATRLRYCSCHAIVRYPPPGSSCCCCCRRCRRGRRRFRCLLLGLRLRLRQRHPAERAGSQAPALGGRRVAPPDHLHLVAPPRGLLVHHEPPHQDVVRQRLAAEHTARAELAGGRPPPPHGVLQLGRGRRRHQRAHAAPAGRRRRRRARVAVAPPRRRVGLEAVERLAVVRGDGRAQAHPRERRRHVQRRGLAQLPGPRRRRSLAAGRHTRRRRGLRRRRPGPGRRRRLLPDEEEHLHRALVPPGLLGRQTTRSRAAIFSARTAKHLSRQSMRNSHERW